MKSDGMGNLMAEDFASAQGDMVFKNDDISKYQDGVTGKPSSYS